MNNNVNNNVIVGIFEDRYQARQAVNDLEHAGFSHDDIGFAIRGHEVADGGMITDAVGTKDGAGALAGAATGAVAGGLMGALVSLVIPPLGPVVLGGILASVAGFAGAGAAVGGIIGAMTGLGLSEDEARFYEEQFTQGKAIVTVNTHSLDDRAASIIEKHGGTVRRDHLPPPGPSPIHYDFSPP